MTRKKNKLDHISKHNALKGKSPEKLREWKLKKLQKRVKDVLIENSSNIHPSVISYRNKLTLELLILELELGFLDKNTLVPLCKKNFDKLIQWKNIQ